MGLNNINSVTICVCVLHQNMCYLSILELYISNEEIIQRLIFECV